MILIKRTPFPSKGLIPYVLKDNNQVVCPINYPFISDKYNSERLFQQTPSPGDLRKLLHTTHVKRDLEAGLRAVGAGMAATGVIGSGIGLGNIFGNLLASVARNPSMANKAFTNAIMGAAFCESLGLFALVVAFIVMG